MNASTNRKPITKLATAALVAVLAAILLLSVMLLHGTSAHASGTNVSTTTTSKTLLNSKCYVTNTRTVTVYHHAAGKGWERYAAPRVTTSHATTCYAK